MDITFHRPDGAHGMLLLCLGRPRAGLHRPASGTAGIEPTIAGKSLSGEHRFRVAAALACHAWANHRRAHWSCDSEAMILTFNRER